MNIESIHDLSDYLNSFDNLSMSVDDETCTIHLSDKLVAYGKLDKRNGDIIERLEKMITEKSGSELIVFLYTESEIYVEDALKYIGWPGRSFSEFARYFLKEYPQIRAEEIKVETGLEELTYSISDLSRSFISYRRENKQIKKERDTIYNELINLKQKFSDLETKLREISSALEHKKLLVIQTLQYLTSRDDILNSRLVDSINNYCNKKGYVIYNKIVSFYEKSKIISLSYNLGQIIGASSDAENYGITYYKESSERIIIFFDGNGEIINLDEKSEKKLFDIDWETFLELSNNM